MLEPFFQFFPSCIEERVKQLELHLNNFQFFPSCILPAPVRNRFIPILFQFFPSCINVLRSSSSTHVLTLSILSQLHPEEVYNNLVEEATTAFNSFPVASSVKSIGEKNATHRNFQFFPSCIRKPFKPQSCRQYR
ncbi:MAG: hypothetical protein N3E41_08610 [Thermofilaceae archaeon]|nr:hypothetical protein [Thermofilaceae archaeon]